MKHQTYNNFILSQSAFYLLKYFRHLNKFHEDNWKSTPTISLKSPSLKPENRKF